MGEQSCSHPRSKVRITETASDMEVGNAPPKYWTIFGECECGEVVELDYEFNKVQA